MPVNYSQYLVDPWKGAKEADIMNLQRNQLAQRQREADDQRSLNERRLALSETSESRRLAQGDEANKYLREQRDMTKADKERQTLLWKAQTIGGMLESVNNEQTWQTFRGGLEEMAKVGMITPEELARTPAHYDPEDVAKKRAMLNAVGKKDKKGGSSGFTLSPEQTRYDDEGNVIATAPRKKGSEKLEKDKTRDKIYALNGINSVYAQLYKQDWKPGKKMGVEQLEQINLYRETINLPPLTEKQSSEDPSSWLKPWTWGGGPEITYEPEATPPAETVKSPKFDADAEIVRPLKAGKLSKEDAANNIKKAYKDGLLTKDEALKLLRTELGYN